MVTLETVGMKKKNIIVIGAGPGGLAAAWNLVQDGHRVLLLEKEPHTGGAAATFKKDGFSYDLGPHLLHPHKESVIQFFYTNLKKHLQALGVISVEVFFRGQRYRYPLDSQVFKILPIFTSLICGVSFLWQRLRLFLGISQREDGSYKTWVVNRFGKQFYDVFFGPYTEKTWGIPALQLSDTIAKKRIQVRGLSDLIKSLLFKTSPHDPNHPESHQKMVRLYPKNGIAEVSNFFIEGIRKFGGEIKTDCNVNEITFENRWVTRLAYTQNGERKQIDFRQEGGVEQWEVFSSAPINDLIIMADGDIPDTVKEAAGGLDFSAEVFLYLNLNTPDAFNIHLLYFSENEFPFNRIYNIGLFSRNMVPEGKNALCVEYTCSYNDEIWNATANQMFEMTMGPLEKHGLLHRTDVESYHIYHLKHAYPRFRVGYQEKLRTIFDYLETVNNLQSFGRQGLFSYANVDDVIWMAFQFTKHLPYKNRFSLPYSELLPDYIDW
jgi:protoporphyrinogen oxidase